MAVDFTTFLGTVTHILDARLPVLVRGPREQVGEHLGHAAVGPKEMVPSNGTASDEGDDAGLHETRE